MATSVLDRPATANPATGGLARTLALDATVPVILFASAAIVIGLHWDISWHRSIGRDTFWSPPHVLEQVAASLAGLFCGWRVIYTSFLGTDADRAKAVPFWKIFHGPLGGWVCIWGTIAMITSAPFDDWWHSAYGLDVEILSPPHVFLLLGMATVQLGAMLLMLADQNREGTEGSLRRAVFFSTSMGLIVLMFTTVTFEYTSLPNHQHAPIFYQITAALHPILLLAVARAGRARFPATIAAGTYMLVMIVMNWVLALVPATPMLAPIYNQLTHLVPPGFPMLLIFPALAFDLIIAKTRHVSDWLLAPVLGVVFVAVLLLVQWPMSSVLLSLDQPNYFFGIGYWDYSARVGPWTKVFFDVPGYTWSKNVMTGQLDVGAMAVALAIAAALGTVASRAGLAWGRWMTRVQR